MQTPPLPTERRWFVIAVALGALLRVIALGKFSLGNDEDDAPASIACRFAARCHIPAGVSFVTCRVENGSPWKGRCVFTSEQLNLSIASPAPGARKAILI